MGMTPGRIPLILVLLATPLLAAPPERIAEKAGAGEGPAWHDGYLWFTGNNRITRRHHATGRIKVWKENAGGANGLLFDRQGRLVVCEGLNRRVVRYEKDGSVTVLAERFDGHRLNSPNDLTMDAKGRIYFSDPRYGNRDSMELSEESVYRVDEPGEITRILGKAEGIQRPNGVLISPDGKYLYVADNNNNTAGGARKLWRFRVDDLTTKQLLHDWGTSRGPDGLKTDGRRLYVAAGRTTPRPHETAENKGGIYVLNLEGKLETFLSISDEEVTNCAFGGPDGKTLFITAGGNLWSVLLPLASSR